MEIPDVQHISVEYDKNKSDPGLQAQIQKYYNIHLTPMKEINSKLCYAYFGFGLPLIFSTYLFNIQPISPSQKFIITIKTIKPINETS